MEDERLVAGASPRTPLAWSSAAEHSESGSIVNAVKSFLAGGLSGAIAKSSVAPLDRLKIIFQISHMQYGARALLREFNRVLHTEGFHALFRGNFVQLLRVYPYSGVQLMTYDLYADALIRLRAGGAGRGDDAAALPIAPLSDHDVPSAGSSAAALRKSRATGLEKMLAGAAAGATSVAVTYPLDLLRARIAVQMLVPPPEALVVPLMRSSATAAVPEGIVMGAGAIAQPAASAAAAAPAAAASAAAATAAPVLLRALGSATLDPAVSAAAAVAAPSVTLPQGTGATIARIYAEHGIVSFYRGMMPTMLGILPYAGSSFYIFATCKQVYADMHGGREPNAWFRLAFGGLAGLVGQLFAYPFDTVRRRMQTEGYTPIHAHAVDHGGAQAPHAVGMAGGGGAGDAAAAGVAPPQRSMVETARRLIAAEGARGLFKGVTLNFVKGPVAVGVSFTTFDLLKKVADIR